MAIDTVKHPRDMDATEMGRHLKRSKKHLAARAPHVSSYSLNGYTDADKNPDSNSDYPSYAYNKNIKNIYGLFLDCDTIGRLRNVEDAIKGLNAFLFPSPSNKYEQFTKDDIDKNDHLTKHHLNKDIQKYRVFIPFKSPVNFEFWKEVKWHALTAFADAHTDLAAIRNDSQRYGMPSVSPFDPDEYQLVIKRGKFLDVTAWPKTEASTPPSHSADMSAVALTPAKANQFSSAGSMMLNEKNERVMAGDYPLHTANDGVITLEAIPDGKTVSRILCPHHADTTPGAYAKSYGHTTYFNCNSEHCIAFGGVKMFQPPKADDHDEFMIKKLKAMAAKKSKKSRPKKTDKTRGVKGGDILTNIFGDMENDPTLGYYKTGEFVRTNKTESNYMQIFVDNFIQFNKFVKPELIHRMLNDEDSLTDADRLRIRTNAKLPHNMNIILGEEGVGKSTFAAWLVRILGFHILYACKSYDQCEAQAEAFNKYDNGVSATVYESAAKRLEKEHGISIQMQQSDLPFDGASMDRNATIEEFMQAHTPAISRDEAEEILTEYAMSAFDFSDKTICIITQAMLDSFSRRIYDASLNIIKLDLIPENVIVWIDDTET